MSFRILDKTQRAIPINKIDEEICKLWNKTPDKKWYATPKQREDFEEGLHGQMEFVSQSNWFDSIGWRIHNDKCKNWDELKKVYENDYAEIIKEFDATIEEILPEIFLVINTFKEKGYTPEPLD